MRKILIGAEKAKSLLEYYGPTIVDDLFPSLLNLTIRSVDGKDRAMDELIDNIGIALEYMGLPDTAANRDQLIHDAEHMLNSIVLTDEMLQGMPQVQEVVTSVKIVNDETILLYLE